MLQFLYNFLLSGFQNNNFNDRQPFFDRNEFDDRSIGRNDRNDRGNRGRDNDRRSMNRHNEDRHEDRHAPNTQDRQGPTNNFRIDKKREGNSRWTNQKNDEQEEFPSDWDASAPEVESNTNKIFEDNGPPGFEEGFDESERLAAPAQDKSEDKSERNEHFEEKSSENVEMNDQRGEESSKAFERSENNDREMESEQREQREDIFEREERNERMDAPADDSFQESNQQHEQCHQDIFKDTPQHNEPEVAPHADDSQCGNTTPLCDELESKD